jgi:hypothetical protein
LLDALLFADAFNDPGIDAPGRPVLHPILRVMVFMVIEQFRPGALARIHERFATEGRLMPPDVEYHGSWIDPSAMRCFQIMEAPDRDRLREWTRRWDDLVDFEIVPVLTSQEFWTRAP